jgi:exodeoxyribonuclease V alpha subunit
VAALTASAASAASPRGVLAPDPADELGALFDRLAAAAGARDLDAEDLFIAEELARVPWSMGGRQRRSLALLICAVLVAARQGSTRLPLGGGAGGYLGTLLRSLAELAGVELDLRATLADVAELCRARSLDRVVGEPGERLPLIAAGGALYLERHHAGEGQLVERLAALLESPPRFAAGAVADAVGAIARTPFALSPEQSAAVAAAAAGPLAVVSGGPGTGKTAIVVALLRALVRLGVAPGEIALAAPTGKAAQRLDESIDRSLAGLADPSAADRDLAAARPGARTVHRLLGYAPRSGRWRHHRNHPLPARVLIVDEASMLDLELVVRLLAALAPGSSLVLLGDADQLPSVEAGAVLRELVLAGEAPPRPGTAAFAHRLTRSYRMDSGEPGGRRLAEAAARIRDGETRGLVGGAGLIPIRARCEDLTGLGAELLETDATIAETAAGLWRDRLGDRRHRAALASRVYRLEGGRFRDEDRVALETLLSGFERTRILCATRRGPAGCDAINRRLHAETLAGSSLEVPVAFYPGEPIIVRQNDYDRDLFNGEQGVVLRVESGGGRHQFRAVFRDRAGGFRAFVLDALRHGLELSFAITVHQSQGSEADEIALILPERDLPILTRELVYTGLTRARRSAVIVGHRALLRAAAARAGERFSGIAQTFADRSRQA